MKWLVSGRRGHPARLLDALGADPGYRPGYLDMFGKLEDRFDSRTRLTLHVLSADEEVEGLSADDVFETSREPGKFRALHASRYGWMSVTRSLGPRLITSTTASVSRLTLDRFGANPLLMEVRDARAVSIVGLKHDWAWQSGRHLARWGLDLKQMSADYRFASTLRPNAPAGAAPGIEQPSPPAIARSPSGRDLAVHVSDRIRVLPGLLVDVGVRGEQQTYGLDREMVLGPRANAMVTLTDKTLMKLGWALVSQPARIYELQVEDGIRDFHPPERAEHRTLTVARELAGGEARVTVYRTNITDVTPRFENAFEPFGFFPAASEDRVRVAADRARAEGIEVAVSRRARARLEWSAAYALARTEDLIGGRWVPRAWDQRHAVDGTLVWRPGDRWDVTLAAGAHSGWPVTPLVRAADPESGGWITTIGERNSRRLPWSRRLDLRLSRRVTLGGFLPASEAQLSLTVANIFNESPASAAERRYALQDPPRLITLGVSWSF